MRVPIFCFAMSAYALRPSMRDILSPQLRASYLMELDCHFFALVQFTSKLHCRNLLEWFCFVYW